MKLDTIVMDVLNSGEHLRPIIEDHCQRELLIPGHGFEEFTEVRVSHFQYHVEPWRLDLAETVIDGSMKFSYRSKLDVRVAY